jgi:hypothetical protein
VASRDKVLRGQVEEALRGRQHWSVQPSPSPGLPAQWCFLSGPEIELSVTVEGGSIVVYVMDLNAEVFLPDGASLVEWLDANEGLFADRPSMAAELFHDVLTGRFDEWGRQGLHSR